MLSLPWRRTRRNSVPARLTAAAIFGSAASVAALVATDVIPVPTWAIPGVDIASHQHPGGAAIDWQQVAASGQKFAFIKASESTWYTNPYFSSDSVKAQQAGVMPGSYHYARPGSGDPRAEARYYASVLATGPQPSLPPVLDLEESGGLPPAQLADWTREWIDEIKTLTGRQPIIYTYYSFWMNEMGNTTEFAEYPLWLAYYSDSLPADIPGGWNEVTFWQHSDAGNVPGIITNVDMNHYNGSDEQLAALAADMPTNTTAGQAASVLGAGQDIVNQEADVANAVEHATGVNMPIASDFMLQLLGVVGGRLSPEVLINNGLGQLSGPILHEIANATGQSLEDVNGSVDTDSAMMPGLTALAGALGEAQQGGGVPVDAILDLLNSAGAANGAGSVDLGEVLTLIQRVGGTSDWAGKLQRGEIQVDPNALEGLARAAQ